MNTRKANLKKLRLPSTETKPRPRNGYRQATSTVSHFFSTDPENALEEDIKEEAMECSEPMPSPIEYLQPMPSPIENLKDEPKDKKNQSTRTKLKTFLPKDKRMKPSADNALSGFLIKPNDFESPRQSIKVAPKIKENTKTKTKAKAKPRPKRQQKIKSAFFQNEELFSDVTAQHCLVDNINPDEMQMALALSRSEVEISGSSVENNSTGKNEGIREKLKKFGFHVAESEEFNYADVYKMSKGKNKWANKFTPLTLRNSTRQLEKVNQKIDEILKMQLGLYEETKDDEEVSSWSSSVQSSILLPLIATNRIIQPNSNARLETIDFYVLSLFEPSRTKPGHLLKNMRRIPGRDRSPVSEKLSSKGDCVMHNEDSQLQSPLLKRFRVEENNPPIEFVLSPKTIDTDSNDTIEFSKQSTISMPFDSKQRRRKTPSIICCQNTTAGDSMIESISSISCQSESNLNSDEETLKQFDSIPMHETNFTTANSTNGSQINSSILLRPIRANSPDIFADSDVEMETDDVSEMEKLKCTSSGDNIECYEIFSSDEVKTFSDSKVDSCDKNHKPLTALIDLTQQESDASSQSSMKLIPLSSEPIQTYQEFNDSPSTFFGLQFNEETLTKSRTDSSFISNDLEKSTLTLRKNEFSFGSNASDDFCKSISLNQSNNTGNSIDLTQNEEDEAIDCIVLSDDEVNYSIRKADKSLHVKNEKSSPDNSFESDTKEEQEFSFVDFVAATQPLVTQDDQLELSSLGKRNNSVSSLEIDISKRSDFGIFDEQSPFKTPTKTPKKTPRKTPTNSPKSSSTTTKVLSPDNSFASDTKEEQEFSFVDFVAATQPLVTQDEQLELSSSGIRNNSVSSLEMDISKRSDFGILDEQSPFKTPTKTPKKTPRKTPTSTTTKKCRRTLSESFLGSSMECSVPLKRFSSSNKFKEFTKSDEESFSDLDDIDKLIYGSPTKKVYKKPVGLTQLLTGAINEKTVTPEKSNQEVPQEFEFNGRTYLVRTVDVSRRPNFATMDESTLLDKLYRYGIKPLKRKQAEKILEYIYNQTHPCLVDESDLASNSMSDHNTQDEGSDRDAVNILDGDEIEVGGEVDSEAGSSKFNLKDCWGHVLVSGTIPSMEIKDEEYFFQTNNSKKVSTAPLPLHIAWYNLLKSNTQLHEAILYYEPIDLQEVYQFLKGIGYRYDPKEMKYFFDSRSIIFRYDVKKSESSAGNRHVRKKRQKVRKNN